MSSTTKFILVFIGSGIAMFLIFYFYPAEIFDATVTGINGTEMETSLSLRAFLGNGDLPDDVNAANVLEVKNKLSGWMILFICVLGLPLMFAYRSVVTKEPRKKED